MTREEAINIVRNIYQTDAEKEALQALIPELAESEDERIRKDIVAAVEMRGDLTQGRKSEIYAYLEKQKDASKAIEAVDRIDKYIDEHLANAHDMKDSNPDKKYYRGWDDALGKMAGILQDVYSGEKQKEQEPEKKPSMLELLREHLANTPKEQLDAEFEALKEFTIPKPTEWSEEDEKMRR